MDPSGQYVFVANYGAGTVSVIPYNQSTGALGFATDVKVLTGPLGSTHAVGAPAQIKGPVAGTGDEMWVKVNPQAYRDLAQRHLAGLEPI